MEITNECKYETERIIWLYRSTANFLLRNTNKVWWRGICLNVTLTVGDMSQGSVINSLLNGGLVTYQCYGLDAHWKVTRWVSDQQLVWVIETRFLQQLYFSYQI